MARRISLWASVATVWSAVGGNHHTIEIGISFVRAEQTLHGSEFGANSSARTMPEPAAQLPTPERKPAWRAACVAYREKRRAGAFDHEAHCAAVAALQAVWPLPWKEASAEVSNAVHFASVYHKEWLWDGVRGEDYRIQIAPERT